MAKMFVGVGECGISQGEDELASQQSDKQHTTRHTVSQNYSVAVISMIVSTTMTVKANSSRSSNGLARQN